MKTILKSKKTVFILICLFLFLCIFVTPDMFIRSDTILESYFRAVSPIRSIYIHSRYLADDAYLENYKNTTGVSAEPYHKSLLISNSIFITLTFMSLIVFVCFLVKREKIWLILLSAILLLPQSIYQFWNYFGAGAIPSYFNIALILFIVGYYVKLFFDKHPLPQRPPRPRKPTQAERIAELEKQVEELKNNQR